MLLTEGICNCIKSLLNYAFYVSAYTSFPLPDVFSCVVYLLSYVFQCLSCLVPYVPSCLTCIALYVPSCLMCLVRYVLSYSSMFLVLYDPEANLSFTTILPLFHYLTLWFYFFAFIVIFAIQKIMRIKNI